MKSTLLTLFAAIISLHVSATHVIIIESQTSASWADQDTHWKSNAEALGYTAEILPQSTLDNLSNLSSADILLVSSGIFTFLSSDHLNTVVDFVIGGRSAYIQAEYLTSFQGNITFQAIMDAANADFAWTAPISGQLTPMNIIGDLAWTPNETATLDYFNYGYAGAGEDVDPFLEFEGNNFGFCYVDPEGNYGTVITTSDEDWAWQDYSPALMQNILYKLLQGTNSIPTGANFNSLEIYPNPCNTQTTLRFSAAMSQGQIKLINSAGQIVRSMDKISGPTYVIERRDLASGVYLVQVMADGVIFETKTLVVE